MNQAERKQVVFEQPTKSALTPDQLPILPRRWAWKRDPQTSKWKLIVQMPYPQVDNAACAGMNVYTQDQYSPSDVATMRQTCVGCPINTACLWWGLAHERYGFIGGLTAEERSELRNQVGLLLVEPHNAHQDRLNESLLTQPRTHCTRGHALRPDVDFVRKCTPVDDRYRHVYQVSCSQCYYEANESAAARRRRGNANPLGAGAFRKATEKKSA